MARAGVAYEFALNYAPLLHSFLSLNHLYNPRITALFYLRTISHFASELLVWTITDNLTNHPS